MKKIGFDNDKYLKLQSENIRRRVEKFGDKLYLEFGGKLFDDYHASRVLPGFEPDSKIKMLLKLKDTPGAVNSNANNLLVSDAYCIIATANNTAVIIYIVLLSKLNINFLL